MRRVRIQTNGPGGGPGNLLEVDGHDLTSSVAAYALTHVAGQFPQLLVELPPSTTAQSVFEGEAWVVVGEQPDPGQAAAAFLAAIDAAELEKAALARHDLQDGGPHELTRAMLAQLTEWALGKEPPIPEERGL
ncbi:hypothetical protein GCM10020367_20910 [Streptomyces sannanensis]|uniref:Uncharacterized protein n=1 Tax=Streptomyces sannanensis TaxID=285536 RepID=A0ABP6S998_9ACTN